MEGQFSLFDYMDAEKEIHISPVEKKTAKTTLSYPCSDCLLYNKSMSCGVNPLIEFCKKHVTEYDFCHDADINQIVFKLQNICANQRMQLDKPQYGVWEHVPNLGKRMSMWAHYGLNTMPTKELYKQIEEVVKFAGFRSIELSICRNPYCGIREGITQSLMFSTLYLDDRKKEKIE